MHTPTPLQPGDTVAILAPSGPCDASKLANGVRVLQNLGLHVQVMESCHASHGYLAGPDALRLRDLHAAFADKKIKGIFAARGGYGAARLLPCLDYKMIRQNPKIFVGFSDVTALHIVLNQFCKLVTLHGPMPATCFDNPHPQTLESFKNAIFNLIVGATALGRPDTTSCEQRRPGAVAPTLKTLYPGTASGILTGGNLTVIASTLGTPYEINTRGRILFLEETGEAPYRVDRLLLQIKLSGKLNDAAGIIFGDFSPETLTTLRTAIEELILPLKKPTLWGLPCGHSSPNITLPLGAAVSLQTEHPHRQIQVTSLQHQIPCQTGRRHLR